MNLNDNDIYKKTAAGADELSNSKDSLMSSWLRSILILIDGKKKYSEYVKVFSNHKSINENGGVDAQFELLLELGLLEKEVSEALIQDSDFLSDGFGVREQTPEKVTQAVSKLSEIAETDLAEDSWEVILDIETCQTEAEIKDLIKSIITNHKQRLSSQSIKVIKKIYKQI